VTYYRSDKKLSYRWQTTQLV